MKALHSALILVALVVCLAGCGGGGGGPSFAPTLPSSSEGSSSSSSTATGSVVNTAVGSVQVNVTNPSLPSNTASLLYNITDQNGNVVINQRFAYTAGQPPSEFFTSIPAETDVVTVQAQDANNETIIQGSTQVFVNIDASPTATVTVGDPNAIALIQFVSQPSNVVQGAKESTIVVGLVNATNTIAVSSTQTVTLAIGTNPGGGTLGGTLTVTPTFGLATFSGLTVSQIGTGYTLVASSGNVPTVASNGFNVVAAAGAPAQLAFTVQPFPNTTINIPFAPSPELAIEDASSVIVNTSSSTVNLAIGNNPSGAFLAGTVSLAATNGIATFSGISINAQGSDFTLTGSSGGLVSVTSSMFNMLNDQSGPNPQTGDVDNSGNSGDGGGLFGND